mmetsp:Transcript_100007/g.122359  ORF Transcript_100007/g.122359 Transcript_100007/m.122359 type:complete len:371 (+) Transcript_100007:20-1132(+)
MAGNATIEFHGKDSKYFLAPDFTGINLSDDASLEEALDYVLLAKKKRILDGEKNILLKGIKTALNSENYNVGGLRMLEDNQWKLVDIPLLCKIYLQHLIKQSQNLSKKQLLECDFNNGLKFNWESKSDEVANLLGLGFDRKDALEGLMVSGHDIEMAAQFLILDPEARQREYQKKLKERNLFVPPNRHHTVIKRLQEEKERKRKWIKKTESELSYEITQLRMQLKAERVKRESLEEKRDKIQKSNNLVLYKEYIKGIIAEPKININEVTSLDKMKNQRQVTDTEHLNALKALGHTEKTFDNLKSFEDIGNGDEDECVVCYEPPKDHMIMPCNHVCLCGDCANTEYPSPHKGQVCPMCNEEVQDIKQVFYF